MKKLYIICFSVFFFLLCVCLLYYVFIGYPTKRTNTSHFLFDEEKGKEIYPSLVEFKELSLKVFNSNDCNLDYHSFYLSSEGSIILDTITLCTWQNFENKKYNIFKIPQLAALSDEEKNKLFDLLKNLNDNYISGISYYTKNKQYTFPYVAPPFFGSRDRFYKHIILKDDFYSMNEQSRQWEMVSQLVTDEKTGMLLIMGDKLRYLDWVYGYDENNKNIPKKWLQPTYEVFKK